MASTSGLHDLPVDIILQILPSLEVLDFLNFTATCRRFYETYIDEHTYWRQATRATFRVPNQPVVQRDGARWHKLYKRLKTQTRAYGWGENSHNCLGQLHDGVTPESPADRGRRNHVCWPEEIGLNGIGTISDLQCGGWSTSALTSTGAVYVCGPIDGQAGQTANGAAHPLAFPLDRMSPCEGYDSATASRQYSHGRSHILALSDSGLIWSWRNVLRVGIKIKFIHHDTLENARGRGAVKKVVAGWDKSAALIEGSGIVVWEPVGRHGMEVNAVDVALVLESAVVPLTNPPPTEAASIGKVVNFIVLERAIVFCTDAGRAFASEIMMIRGSLHTGPSREILIPSADRVTDVQGTFRNAAVFTESGAVLTTTQDRLLQPEVGGLERIPALQNSQVIAVAFGDYHYHALHASGYISSYGKEPQSCGALGLGGYASPEGRIRGIRHEGAQFPGMARARGDGFLVPQAYQTGRRVWFEKEKREWIKYLTSGGVDAREAAERIRMSLGSIDFRAQGELSEWIEQEGRDWEDKYDVRQDGDDDLPAYFALSVAAAGWHSAALVLVNDELADRIKDAVEIPESECIPNEDEPMTGLIAGLASSLYELGRGFLGAGAATKPPTDRPTARARGLAWGASPRPGYRYAWAYDSFPRLRLSDGTEMPGRVPFNGWRYGKPVWNPDTGIELL